MSVWLVYIQQTRTFVELTFASRALAVRYINEREPRGEPVRFMTIENDRQFDEYFPL